MSKFHGSALEIMLAKQAAAHDMGAFCNYDDCDKCDALMTAKSDYIVDAEGPTARSMQTTNRVMRRKPVTK